MNKQLSSYKSLGKNFEKIIKTILYQSSINFSSKSSKFLAEFCLKIVEAISGKIAGLNEKNPKKTLSEDEILLIFNELGLNKYVIEISEEKSRLENENQKLENIIV